MVAWQIWLGTALFGQSAFAVRIGALCCGAVTSFFAYRLTRNLFGEESALRAVLLAQILPFFFLSAFLMTPDAPLTAAWAASLYFLERALVAGRRDGWWRAGVALGLGALSKYSIGLLAAVALLFMTRDSDARRWWRRWEPYGAALLTLAIFSPVIIWNAQHEWASFAFQTSRRLAEAPRFALHKLIASSPHSHHAHRSGGRDDRAHARTMGRVFARTAVHRLGHSDSADRIRALQPASRGKTRLDRRAVDRRAAGHGVGNDRRRIPGCRTDRRLDTRRMDAHSGNPAVDLRGGPALLGARTSRAGLWPAYRAGSGRVARPSAARLPMPRHGPACRPARSR